MAQYPSYGLGSGNVNRQNYGLTGMSQMPDYTGIIRKQASNLPALYALRGAQKQKERELSLAEQALGQNLQFEKDRLASTERISGEELALTRSLAESEAEQRERLAKEQQQFQEEQAGTSNLIGGASTAMNALRVGKWVYDKWGTPAGSTPAAIESSTYGTWAGAGEPALTPGSYGIATGGAGAGSGMGAYGAQQGAQFAGWGSAGAGSGAGAGFTTGAAAMEGTAATTSGAATAEASAMPATIAGYAGPIAAAVGTLLTMYTGNRSHRKKMNAFGDFRNSPEGEAWAQGIFQNARNAGQYIGTLPEDQRNDAIWQIPMAGQYEKEMAIDAMNVSPAEKERLKKSISDRLTPVESRDGSGGWGNSSGGWSY